MTNKDSIQQKHLEAIENETCGDFDETLNDWEIGQVRINAATSCTTVTAEAIGEAMAEFKNNWIEIDGMFLNVRVHKSEQVKLTIEEWVQLFLNQKAKI